MAAKSKKDNKIAKAKDIVKKINGDLIDASFKAIETTVETGEKWQKLTSKLIKKAEPLTTQQMNMFVETAETLKGQLENGTDRLKTLVGYDPKMVDQVKKMVTDHPVVEKVEEVKNKIQEEVSNNKLVKKAEKMSVKLKKDIANTIEEVKEKIEDYTDIDIDLSDKKEAKKAPAKKTAAKKAPAKKAPSKKAPAKKAVAKKTPAKKAPAKKTVAKKAPVKKAPVKKTAATKAPVKKTETKVVAEKATEAKK